MVFVSKKRGKLAFRLFESRKGNILHEIYFLMFQVAMIFLVVIALFQYVNSIAEGLDFEKRFTSIDVALLSTVVFHAPGTLKAVYQPVDFPVPMDFIFNSYLVNIQERGTDLNTFYWFLSDSNIEPLVETAGVRAHTSDDSETDRPEITFYKSGGVVSFDRSQANPLQFVCPVINTTDPAWNSRKIFAAKVLPDQDISDPSLPVNRIVQVLSVQHRNVQSSSSSGSGLGSLISSIPDDASLVIVLGNFGQQREQGSLVVYIPVNDNLLKSRKLACFIINDLLTPETKVFYAQIMPVFVDSIKEDSPLKVFREISNSEQIMVFIDLSSFSEDQIDVDNAADAIYRAIERYYGAEDVSLVSGSTLSFGSAQVIQQPSSEQQQTSAVQSTQSAEDQNNAPGASSLQSAEGESGESFVQ